MCWLFVCAFGKILETSLHLHGLQFLFEPRSLSSPSLEKLPLFSYLTEHLLQVLSFSTTREEGFWDCGFLDSHITKPTVPSCLPADIQRHWRLCLELRGRRASYKVIKCCKRHGRVQVFSCSDVSGSHQTGQDLDTGDWFKAVKPHKVEEKLSSGYIVLKHSSLERINFKACLSLCTCQ